MKQECNLYIMYELFIVAKNLYPPFQLITDTQNYGPKLTELVEEWKSNNLDNVKEDQEEGLVFFMRAGFRDSSKWGMLFWERDQMVSWQTNDGIKSSVVGLLSSGISGYAFNQ
ncbi:Alpha-glucosidase yihQ [Sesbania bispinosa]|nr:Alpha-glucosidase yihQ [Sesbania bispinosa]